jgi:hypothetical protein
MVSWSSPPPRQEWRHAGRAARKGLVAPPLDLIYRPRSPILQASHPHSLM